MARRAKSLWSSEARLAGAAGHMEERACGASHSALSLTYLGQICSVSHRRLPWWLRAREWGRKG